MPKIIIRHTRITNEKAFKNLIKDLDPILLAMLRERVLTICEETANNSEELVNSFIQPRFYVELNKVVQKHLGFDNQ
jgi:hypothetical protein